jgi:hypothetical protein
MFFSSSPPPRATGPSDRNPLDFSTLTIAEYYKRHDVPGYAASSMSPHITGPDILQNPLINTFCSVSEFGGLPVLSKNTIANQYLIIVLVFGSKFHGLNPAEIDGFLKAIKIGSTPSSEGK